MSEELAFIRDVGVGQRDCSSPVLWFDVRGEHWGALQVFSLEDDIAVEILSSVYNLKDLDGKPCIVEKEEGRVKFKRLVKA